MKHADRIAELERRVRELEARPPQIVHVPVHVPVYVPAQPAWTPAWPNYPWSPIITCGASQDSRATVTATEVWPQ